MANWETRFRATGEFVSRPWTRNEYTAPTIHPVRLYLFLSFTSYLGPISRAKMIKLAPPVKYRDTEIYL